jgi:hypothetical protein
MGCFLAQAGDRDGGRKSRIVKERCNDNAQNTTGENDDNM